MPDDGSHPMPARDAVTLLAEVLARLTANAHVNESIQPEGLDAKSAGTLLGVSVSTVYDLDSRGLMPEAVTLGDGRCRRWLRSELLAWLRGGAPSRLKWQLIKSQASRRSAG